jgi:F0F1-type ATP synthase membrane subunit c/vacuolar-type H+-ATPase subunit K
VSCLTRDLIDLIGIKCIRTVTSKLTRKNFTYEDEYKSIVKLLKTHLPCLGNPAMYVRTCFVLALAALSAVCCAIHIFNIANHKITLTYHDDGIFCSVIVFFSICDSLIIYGYAQGCKVLISSF